MIPLRISSLAVLVLFTMEVSQAQLVDSAQSGDGLVHKVYSGAVRSLAWYDIPIASADLAELLFVSSTSTDKPIKFPPTEFDTRFQSHVGVHGSQTIIARTGEEGLAALFGMRLLVNIGADLTGGDVTAEDYRRTFWFYKSIVYTYSITALAKDLVYRMRPDGSDSQSFFSGHSSTAFCAASYLSLELNDWFDHWEKTRTDDNLRLTLKVGSSVAFYAGAVYVAYSRIHDEKHYVSDVAVGAVVGTAVGTLMYHWYSLDNNRQYAGLSFFMVDKTPAVLLTMCF